MISYRAMIGTKEIIDPLHERCKTEVFNPPIPVWDEKWKGIREDLLIIEEAQFDDPSSEDLLEQHFQEPGTVVILLRDTQTKKVVGFSYSIPLRNYVARNGKNYQENIEREDNGKNTAYIMDTAIHPDYTGHHLVGKLMDTLEDVLRQRRYAFIERDAKVKNGYANNIRKNSAGRIVGEPIYHDSDWGPQVFFRLRL